MAENNGYVKRWVFIWAIGVLLTLFIGSITSSMSAQSRIGDVEVEQAGISTDLMWIRTTLTEIKLQLDKLRDGNIE